MNQENIREYYKVMAKEDQLLALEILQTAEQQKRGEFYDGSKLIQEAIDLLIKKHMIAIKLKR
jgi:hypothetical protein